MNLFKYSMFMGVCSIKCWMWGEFRQCLQHLFSSVSEDTLHVVARILSSSATTITVRMMKVEKQANLSDCGVLAIAIAHEICCGQSRNCNNNQTELCLHLAACLEAFRLSVFPREPRKRQACVKSLTKVELHCVCWMPHSDRFNWAQCDECHVWYHKECMDIPDEVFSSTHEVQWVCKICHWFLHRSYITSNEPAIAGCFSLKDLSCWVPLSIAGLLPRSIAGALSWERNRALGENHVLYTSPLF
jgi:hypothetical protein